MVQIKIAAALVLPLVFVCSLAFAQEQQSGAVAKESAPSPASPPPQTQAQQESYGSYAPYVTQPEKSVLPQGAVTDVLPETCGAPPPPPPDEVYGPYVPYTGPLLGKVPKCQVAETPPAADTPDTNSSKRIPSPQTQPQQEAYGPYVPYVPSSQGAGFTPSPVSIQLGDSTPKVAPPQREVTDVLPKASYSQNDQIAHRGVTHPDFSSTTQPESPAIATPPLEPVKPASTDLALSTSAAPAAGAEGFIRSVPAPQTPKVIPPDRPFRNIIIGFKGNTLGAGIEIATPVSRTLYLRSSFNMLAFDYPFSIHGVNYDARLHFKSSGTTLDWYPNHHGFRISPGILWVKNALNAPASVGPGQVFKLSTQTFLNSVDDPVSGYASVVYPHSIAPMVLFGFRNTIPRTSGHLTIPVEFGVAYTGAPKINVVLDGTACTTDGCFSFDSNADAQKFLKQEVQNLNDNLRYFPVYPILSVGVAFHF
jgi:hypothetical protein